MRKISVGNFRPLIILLASLFCIAVWWYSHRSFATSKHQLTLAQIGFLQDKLLQCNNAQYIPLNPYIPLKLDKCITPKDIGDDAWGHKFIYIFPAKYGTLEFDLYSRGANGEDEYGHGDDITNWNGFNVWYYWYP